MAELKPSKKKNVAVGRDEITSPGPAPLCGAKFIQGKDVMPLFGYTDRASFWAMVRRSGLPFCRINSRRCVFRESDIEAWMKSRTVGTLPQEHVA